MLLKIVTNSTNKKQFHAFIPTVANFTLEIDQKIWQRSSWLLRGLLLVDGSEEGDHEVDGAAADDEGGEADDERRVIRVADRHRHFNGVDILENKELTDNWLRVSNNNKPCSYVVTFKELLVITNQTLTLYHKSTFCHAVLPMTQGLFEDTRLDNFKEGNKECRNVGL